VEGRFTGRPGVRGTPTSVVVEHDIVDDTEYTELCVEPASQRRPVAAGPGCVITPVRRHDDCLVHAWGYVLWPGN
jgi:hypothetical protein